jgi:Na+-transporting NADH:ubiquinone oxidoreductase subunit B
MNIARKVLDRIEPYFTPGGRLQNFYGLYEAVDTFLFTPGSVTKRDSHIRDSLDLKRMMLTVVIALIPCMLMAMYNTGLQANLHIEHGQVSGIRAEIIKYLGLGFNPQSILDNFVHGALYFIPILMVCNIAGGFWEIVFALVRKHEVNEGFFVTGVLFPLTLPATIPLWQVAIGISFGVIFGKEVFGGTGKNFLNPALTARAFLFFAYPAEITGDSVWIPVDGFSGATALSLAAEGGAKAVSSQFTWMEAFLGTIPGSMGETSTLACLIGAVILILTGIGSWRIMLGMLLGGAGFSSLLWMVGSSTNPMFTISPVWHLVLGGFAFGLVFMVTDPVSAAMTRQGQYLYSFLVGVVSIMVRSLNPAFPEGVMLAILFGNLFAPLIDYYVLRGNIKRRRLRAVEVKDVQ